MVIKHQHHDLLKHIILERMVFQPPLIASTNMHNEACFLYLVNGSSFLHGPTDTLAFNSNDGVVMKCGNYLNSYLSSADGEPFEALAVHFYPDVLRLVYKDGIPDFLKQQPASSPVAIERIKVDNLLKQYVENLRFYFDNPTLINEELIVLKVKELMLLLVNSDSSNQVRNILRDLFNPIEYSFKEIIHQHLFENLSLDHLAILTDLSLSSFKRKFKEVFDASPAQYIRTKRLEKAADLLRVSKARISDIAFDCGFNDTGHFSKTFSVQYGCSPSTYRDQHLS